MTESGNEVFVLRELELVCSSFLMRCPLHLRRFFEVSNWAHNDNTSVTCDSRTGETSLLLLLSLFPFAMTNMNHTKAMCISLLALLLTAQAVFGFAPKHKTSFVSKRALKIQLDAAPTMVIY